MEHTLFVSADFELFQFLFSVFFAWSYSTGSPSYSWLNEVASANLVFRNVIESAFVSKSSQQPTSVPGWS